MHALSMITWRCEWSYHPWCILCKPSSPASLLTKTCVHCHALGILSCPGYSQLLSPLGFLSWLSFFLFSRWHSLHLPPTPKHHSSVLKILVQFDALRKFLAASLVWNFVSFATLSCNHLLIWLTLHMAWEFSGDQECGGFHILYLCSFACLGPSHIQAVFVKQVGGWIQHVWMVS